MQYEKKSHRPGFVLGKSDRFSIYPRQEATHEQLALALDSDMLITLTESSSAQLRLSYCLSRSLWCSTENKGTGKSPRNDHRHNVDIGYLKLRRFVGQSILILKQPEASLGEAVTDLKKHGIHIYPDYRYENGELYSYPSTLCIQASAIWDIKRLELDVFQPSSVLTT